MFAFELNPISHLYRSCSNYQVRSHLAASQGLLVIGALSLQTNVVCLPCVKGQQRFHSLKVLMYLAPLYQYTGYTAHTSTQAIIMVDQLEI